MVFDALLELEAVFNPNVVDVPVLDSGDFYVQLLELLDVLLDDVLPDFAFRLLLEFPQNLKPFLALVMRGLVLESYCLHRELDHEVRESWLACLDPEMAS